MFTPLQIFADFLTCNLLSIGRGTLLASAVNFFIFDTIKILLLLAVMIFAISVLRSFIPPEKVRLILSRHGKYTGHCLAAALGIITPFCSCSAVPMFLGFVEAGVPLGVTFSFLVSSPMINEVALIMLFGLFGWRIALLYAFSGMVIAIVSGLVIGSFNAEALLEDFVLKKSRRELLSPVGMSWPERILYAREYTADIFKKVWPYVVAGVAAGAWIHGYVPVNFMAHYAGADKWYAVPAATLIGIPLYSNAAGVIPLVSALTEKGVSLGTTLAFMMSVTGLSLPEFMILRRVMKPKLIAIFAGVLGIGIMLTGFLFNFILG
jgi:hypothetical protein